ncbi:MAG: class I SAM-dependent methyltransferase [Balneolaceae bacterium]
MSKIEYDPVKDTFARHIRHSRLLRRIFYFLLDLIFLRSWHMRRLIARYGSEFDKRGEWSLLDAGCGFGQYDRFLLKKFKHINITALDVKEDYLKDSLHYFSSDVSKGRITFEKADLLNLNYKATFDLAICIDVLEHIDEDLRVIRNLYEALKPDGYFLMHSPSHYSEEDADEDNSFVGEHARAGYSKEDLRKKMEKAGFEIVDLHYTYGFFGHKAWIMSVKWPMIWFNKIKLLALIPLLVYYPFVLPFCLVMNASDLLTKNQKGNGIYAIGRKKPDLS